MREAAHTLHGPAFGVEGHEVDGQFSRHFEIGRAIFFYFGKPPDFFGRIGSSARDQWELKTERGNTLRPLIGKRLRCPAALFDFLDHTNLFDLTALNMRLQPFVDVL